MLRDISNYHFQKLLRINLHFSDILNKWFFLTSTLRHKTFLHRSRWNRTLRRVSWQLREHYPLQKLPVNMYVLKRGAFMHVFETIYTFNFILGIIRITQLIKSWLPSIGVSSLVISVSFFFHHSSSLVSESYQTYLFKTQRWQYINLDIFKKKISISDRF